MHALNGSHAIVTQLKSLTLRENFNFVVDFILPLAKNSDLNLSVDWNNTLYYAGAGKYTIVFFGPLDHPAIQADVYPCGTALSRA